jgi:2-methylisocitrate lyase-like PEP mutase family enzyme
MPHPAERLRDLHVPGELLLVPNAYDAASARVLEHAGFPTIATTSSGVAWALGAADGQQLTFEDVVAVVRRIAGAVDVPVSVDFEGGYVEASGGIEQTVRALIDAGAAGINLDDGGYGEAAGGVVEPAVLVERLRAARAAADDAGVPLFLIARTELFWRRIGDEGERTAAAARRIRSYLEAGADWAFVPGVLEPDPVRELARVVDGRLNVMLAPGTPSLDELRTLGVGRATVGASVLLNGLAAIEQAAAELRAGRLDMLGRAPSAEALAIVASRR